MRRDTVGVEAGVFTTTAFVTRLAVLDIELELELQVALNVGYHLDLSGSCSFSLSPSSMHVSQKKRP